MSKKRTPNHYATFSTVIRNMVSVYLKGLDAMIGLLAANLIWGITFLMLWSVTQILVRFPFGDKAADQATPWVLIICAPLIIRLGLSAGGFEIPQMLRKKASDDKIKP